MNNGLYTTETESLTWLLFEFDKYGVNIYSKNQIRVV